MKLSIKIDHLDGIPNGNYVGYYWLSDHETPQMINGNFECPELINNFIIEAMLWDETNKKSIMITHTGKYNIHEYDMTELGNVGSFECKSYMPHRLIGVKKVKFKQLWIPEPDPLCCNFDVLALKAHIFVGFEQ